MEIRLNCNNSLNLNNFEKLKLIRLEIITYNLIKDTLKGDVKVSGEYFKKNNENNFEFEDIIPFTIVFSNNNVNIDNIYIDNDKYDINKEIGVNLSFEIVVNYSIKDDYSETKDTDQNDTIEIPVENEEIEIVSNCDNSEIDEMNLITEEAKEIMSEYDKLLDEIMNNTGDRNDDKNNNITLINANETLLLKNQKTSYNTITVFYLKQENELENISKQRKISINELYKLNDDFSKTRRIIINE